MGWDRDRFGMGMGMETPSFPVLSGTCSPLHQSHGCPAAPGWLHLHKATTWQCAQETSQTILSAWVLVLLSCGLGDALNPGPGATSSTLHKARIPLYSNPSSAFTTQLSSNSLVRAAGRFALWRQHFLPTSSSGALNPRVNPQPGSTSGSAGERDRVWVHEG